MSAPAIQLTGVQVAFGEHAVLDGLDLRVDAGTVFVVMGRSGTGKSVTLKVLCGLLRPDAGSVQVSGHQVERANRKELRAVRERMGFVFQNAALINWLTAGENVALPLLERGRKQKQVDELVRQRLAEVGLEDAAHKYPAELSGGMRKRVGFARATITEPELILYDEPTTGLDPQTTRIVDELIVRGREQFGATSVVVSHDVASSLRVADVIGILDQGRMELVLTPEEFVGSTNPLVLEYLDGNPLVGAEQRSEHA